MIQPVYETQHQMGPYPKILIFLLLGFFPFVGICIMILAVYSAYVSFFCDGYPLWAVAIFFLFEASIATFIVLLGWVFICDGMAKYRFDVLGLYAKYPFRPWQCIPWEEFQQVCICRSAFTTRGEPRANTVICCVRKGEKKTIQNRWKTDNPFRYRSVISIAYTPELHEGIKRKCPFEVSDLRETPAYRLK